MLAAIDVGTNAVRLEMARPLPDGSLELVHQERDPVRPGEGLFTTGGMPKPVMERLLSTLRRYGALCRRHGAKVRAVATSAVREARNRDEIVRRARREGLTLDVISGREEARLICLGVLHGRPPDARALCVDVGGGSTEIAVGTELGGPAWIRSADIGSLRLTRACLPSDPPTVEEVDAARTVARAALAHLIPPRPTVALAVGGSARAAAKVVGRALGPDDLGLVAALCARRPTAKLAKTFGIDRARAETLLAGALVLDQAERLLGVPFRLARGGLREGAALALAERVAAAAAA